MVSRTRYLTVVAGVLAGLAVAVSAQAGPKKGGDVVVAQLSQPKSMDPIFANDIASRNITSHIFETLVTRGEHYEIIPDAAKSFSVNADNTIFSFTLRPGLKFQNGRSVTADDAVASLRRYQRFGSRNAFFKDVKIVKTGPMSLKLITPGPRPLFLEQFSSYVVLKAIVPAEQENQPAGKLNPIIGTGPYKFVKWVPGSYVKLARFDGYVPNPAFKERDGFGGHKVPYFDTITFRFMPEPSTAVAALENGEVQVVESVPVESAKRLAKEDKKNVKILDLKRYWIQCAFFNLANPPFDNLKIRRAVMIGTNLDEIMSAATDGAYELDPSWQYPGTPYYTKAGSEYYNVNDPERAKKLMKEAGYKGQPIIILTNTSYRSMYDAGVVLDEQLTNLGFNVKMKVMDWPGSKQVRNTQKYGWHIFMGAMASGPPLGPTETLAQFVGAHPTQFVKDPKWYELYKEFSTLPTLKARKAAWEKAQAYAYEHAIFWKLGNMNRKQGIRSNVKGFKPYQVPRLYNVWFE